MGLDLAINLGVTGQQQAANALNQIEGSLQRTSTAQLRAAGHYAAGGVALTALATTAMAAARAFVTKADALTVLSNNLRLATGNAASASEAMHRLYGIAQDSRTSFTELGSTYASIARASASLGLSQQRLLTVSEAIGNAMAVGGGSAQGMQAALVQLGQGMASGTLRGEELNSVMEQTPRLAQAIADGLGVTIGQLRAMGAAGELTAATVVKAIESQAAALRDELQSSVMTVSQAMTMLDNATTRAAGAFDKASGTTGALSRFVAGLAGDLDRLSDVMNRSAAAGDGMAKQVNAAAGATLALGVVRIAEASVNSLNYAVNALTGNIFGFSENINLLPRALDTTKNQVNALTRDLEVHRKKLEELNQEYAQRVANGGSGMYLKAEIAATQDLIRETQAAIKARQQLLGGGKTDVEQYDVAETERFNRTIAPFKARQEAIAWQTELQRKLSGEDQEYTKIQEKLAAQLQAGNITFARYVELRDMAWKASKYGAEAEKQLAKAKKDAEREERENLEMRERQLQAQAALRLRAIKEAEAHAQAETDRYRRAAETAKQEADQAEEQLLLYGKLRSEVAALGLEKLKTQLAGLDPDDVNAKLLKSQIEAQKRLVAALKGQEAKQATADAAKAAADEWRRAADQIEQSLTDALMRGFEGGRGFAESLVSSIKSMFKSMVLQPIVQAIVRPMVAGMGLGGSGSAFAGQGGGAMGQLQTAFSALNGFGGNLGTSAAMGADSIGAWLVENTSGAANSAGGWMMQNAGAIGNVAGMAGNAFAGYGVGMALNGGISNGYSVGSGYNKFQQVGMAVTSAVMGPVAGAIVGAVTGLVNRAFGRRPREVTETGITGTIGSSGFAGSAYEDWRRKGGWFRSDRSGRDLSSVDAQVEATLDAGVAALYASAEQYAQALGLPVESARNYSRAFTIAWGKTEEENKAAVEAAMRRLGEDLAGVYGQYLIPLQRAGETLSQTFERLGALQSFSRGLNELGGVFARVANLSVDAREQMIALAGGMDAMRQQSMQFVQDYYSREEIAGLKAREIQQVLSAAGITTDVNSREDFRALVDTTDVSTETGRRQLATLLGVASSFTGVGDFLGETGQTLNQAASAAPQVDLLTSLITAQPQVDAINTVADNVLAVRDAVLDLIDTVKAGASNLAPIDINSYYTEVNPGGGGA